MGSHARHRLRVGGAGRPRHRLAADRRRRARSCARTSASVPGSSSTAWTTCATWARGWGRRARRARDVWYRELEGPRRAALPGVRRRTARALAAAVLHGASRRLGRRVPHLRELGAQCVLALPPEEQYLVATGRTYFRDLAFDELRRLQFDLETHGAGCRARPHLHGRRAPSRPATRRCWRRTADGDAARGGPHPAAGGDGAGGRPGRHREPQPARLRPALPRPARAPAGRAARARPRWAGWGCGERAARRGTARGGRRQPPRALRGARARADRHAGRRAAATTSPRASCRGTGSRPSRGTWAWRRRTASTFPAPQIFTICRTRPRARAALRRRTTWRRWPRSRACWAARRSRWRGWPRAATSGWRTPGPATGVIDPLLVRAYLRAGAALPAHRPRRRHAAQRRGAAPVRHRRGVARGQGRRRQPVPVAHARLSHRPRARPPGRAAGAGGPAGGAAAGRQGARAGGAPRLRRAPHARGAVRGDEARRQLGVRLPGRGGRADALRGRARRQRGDAPRPRDAGASCAASWPRAA